MFVVLCEEKYFDVLEGSQNNCNRFICALVPAGSVQPSAAARAGEPSHLHDVMQRREPVCRQRRRGEERGPLPFRLLPAGQRGGTSPPQRDFNQHFTH